MGGEVTRRAQQKGRMGWSEKVGSRQMGGFPLDLFLLPFGGFPSNWPPERVPRKDPKGETRGREGMLSRLVIWGPSHLCDI